jgi:hypothetical protein
VLECDVVCEAAEDGNGARITRLCRNTRHLRDRHPHVRANGKHESGRHDADDGRRRPVDTNRPAHDGRLGAKLADPHGVPDDDHWLRTHPVVLRPKIAPQGRTLAKEAERVRGNERACEMLSRMSVHRDVHAGARVRGEAGERSRSLLPVEKVQVRHAAVAPLRIPGCEVHDAIGVVYRQILQIPAIDDGEDSRIDADAKRQRRHDGGGKPALLDEQPRCKAQILQEGLHAAQSAGFPMLLFE